MRVRYRKCGACGDYHWTNAWPANHVEPQPQRSSLPSPSVVRDGLDDLVHPITNQRIDSKREFSRITAENGGIEIGNDEQKDMRYTDEVTADDVAQAYHMVDQGYKPRPETATADETIGALA